MAQTAKILAAGQLASSKGTLYTCPASTNTLLGKLVLHNTGGAVETFTVYTKLSGGTSRVNGGGEIPAGGFATVDFERCAITASDLVEGFTTTATTVDYTLYGNEITA